MSTQEMVAHPPRGPAQTFGVSNKSSLTPSPAPWALPQAIGLVGFFLELHSSNQHPFFSNWLLAEGVYIFLWVERWVWVIGVEERRLPGRSAGPSTSADSTSEAQFSLQLLVQAFKPLVWIRPCVRLALLPPQSVSVCLCLPSPGKMWILPHPSGPAEDVGGCCILPLGPDSVTTQSLQPLWTQALWDLSLYGLPNANKRWSISKPGISPETALQRGPKYTAQCLHLEWEAQPRAQQPGFPYVNKGKENSLAVSGETWQGVFQLGWRREGREGGCQLLWVLPANSVETLGLSCELREEPHREFPNNNNSSRLLRVMC